MDGAAVAGMQVSKVGFGGPALFFVHGFACDSSDWAAQVQAFADHTTTVTCDLPGHGQSPAVPGGQTIGAYGAQVVRALDELAVSPAVLVGHSMGCRVVLEAARLNPDAVAGLVLIDGSRIGEGDPVAAEKAMADELMGDGYPRFVRAFFE